MSQRVDCVGSEQPLFVRFMFIPCICRTAPASVSPRPASTSHPLHPRALPRLVAHRRPANPLASGPGEVAPGACRGDRHGSPRAARSGRPRLRALPWGTCVVWLLSSYVEFVWTEKTKKEVYFISADKLRFYIQEQFDVNQKSQNKVSRNLF